MAGTDVSKVTRASSLSDIQRLRKSQREAIDVRKPVFFSEEISFAPVENDPRLKWPRNAAETFRLVTVDVTGLAPSAIHHVIESLIHLGRKSPDMKAGLVTGWNHPDPSPDGRRLLALSGMTLASESGDVAAEMSEQVKSALGGMRATVLGTGDEDFIACPHTTEDD